MFEVGDKVVIINDVDNYIYKVKDIFEKVCLIGVNYRLIKYVQEQDIRLATKTEIEEELAKNARIKDLMVKNKVRSSKAIFGRILHIDGDKEYLDSCLGLYAELGIFAEGLYLPEKQMHKYIESLILQVTPDVIVITGHDAYNGGDKNIMDSYENSEYFIKAIRLIRKHFSIDNVVVIAGACGSHFEALIASGANFASSPKRINTHTYDPAITAIKVASTSINKMVDFDNILKYIDNGKDALGGVETKGKMRLLL